jgi:N-dimethylarginine dimethylaminohydrolase
MKNLLMCRPSHFEVIYDINHWMHDQAGHVDSAKANNQWYNLFDAVSRHCVIHLIDGVKNLPDLVFTANAGFVQGNNAILSKFATQERQPEEQLFRQWFEHKEFSVYQPTANYEGEGDHLIDSKGRHWMGYGFRTSQAAAAEIQPILKTIINTLELVDPRWYHLDTCFCPLPNRDAVVWYPGAFSESAQNKIRASFSNSIEISLQDALLFSCNCICIGDNLFMPAGSTVADQLRALDYNVAEIELSEFLKAGGAAKCLVLHTN